MSGNPAKAYDTLENGIINAHGNISELTEFYKGRDDYSEKLKENVDQVTGDILAEGGTLMKRYPEMFVAARNSFTDAAFTRSIAEYGHGAVTIQRERLAVYKRLVSADEAQQAEHEFANFFSITL